MHVRCLNHLHYCIQSSPPHYFICSSFQVWLTHRIIIWSAFRTMLKCFLTHTQRYNLVAAFLHAAEPLWQLWNRNEPNTITSLEWLPGVPLLVGQSSKTVQGPSNPSHVVVCSPEWSRNYHGYRLKTPLNPWHKNWILDLTKGSVSEMRRRRKLL